MPDLLAVDLQEQIAEVQREIRLRKSVYPRQIAAGRLKPNAAARHIMAMEAVLRTLMELAPPTLPMAA